MKKLRLLVLAAARADYAAPARNASGAPGSGSAVACTSTSDPHLQKFVGLRCCRDRATRQPYTIHIGHGNGGSRGLTHAAMYEPARETLQRGFLARADECGYSVATYFGPLKPETLRDGDVVISFGMNGPYAHGFARAAMELRQRPIAFINYDTEPGGLLPAEKVGMLLPRHHRRRGPGGQMTELWSYAFSHGAKAHRIKIVPPGFLERFPIPETELGPVRVFKWLGMAGRCMDRLPPDVRRRVSEAYGVRTSLDWQRTMAANHTVYLNLHKEHCKRGRPSRDLPAEYFRLSAIVSAGGLVVSEPSHPVDEAALKDIVIFETDIYNKAGGWSAATTELLADAARLRAWRDRALAAYRRRFDPVALLRRADAWNERARGDLQYLMASTAWSRGSSQSSRRRLAAPAVTATRLAPLVVYLMSTRCAPGGFDNLRARVAPAAAAYGARLDRPVVAVVDTCGGHRGLPACDRCAPSPLMPLVTHECVGCGGGVDVVVADCPGGRRGAGPGCKTDAAIAHFAHRFPPATDPAWLAFSDDDMHYSVPWFDALLRLVEGAGHPATAPLALGGRDRGFRRDRLRARFEGENGLAPCTFVGAPRVTLPLVLSSAAAARLAPLCAKRVVEKQCEAFSTTHDTCAGVVLWRLQMRYLPVFEECRLVTNCVEINQ